MKQLIQFILGAASALVVSSALACTYPGDADFPMPNGKEATKEEMIASQKNVKEYVSSVEAYLTCIGDKQESAGDTLNEEQKYIFDLRFNAAVDAMNLVADQFNVELRAYKEAN